MSRITYVARFLPGFFLVAALVLSSAGARIPVRAAALTPRAALVRVLTAPREQPEWFAPTFLAQVSVAQVEQAVADVKARFGPYKSAASRSDGSYLVTFARGTVQAQIHLDGQGRIDGLLFTKPRFTYVSRSSALQSLRALPGQVSLLITKDGADMLTIDSDRSLAVGSAFKLAVLAALQGRIEAGQLSWTEEVTVHAGDKSLPGGVLQTAPDGSRYSVADLARYMISVSDNTAADLLIHLVGRPAIDPLIPQRDRPILTTREAFVLKDPAHRDLRDRYLAASPAERAAILAEADRLPLPSLQTLGPLLATGPVSPRIEWFFSARQLCDLIRQVRNLPQMSVNPGVADPSEWAHVAFKGGSEPGVINLTTMVTAHSGATYCVAATWNNTTLLDEGLRNPLRQPASLPGVVKVRRATRRREQPGSRARRHVRRSGCASRTPTRMPCCAAFHVHAIIGQQPPRLTTGTDPTASRRLPSTCRRPCSSRRTPL